MFQMRMQFTRLHKMFVFLIINVRIFDVLRFSFYVALFREDGNMR